MKHTLRRLQGLNVQFLMGFITKKKNPMGVNPKGVHPALEKEAYEHILDHVKEAHGAELDTQIDQLAAEVKSKGGAVSDRASTGGT